MKAYNDSLIITKLNATIDLFSRLPEIFTAKDFKFEREKVSFCSRPNRVFSFLFFYLFL